MTNVLSSASMSALSLHARRYFFTQLNEFLDLYRRVYLASSTRHWSICSELKLCRFAISRALLLSLGRYLASNIPRRSCLNSVPTYPCCLASRSASRPLADTESVPAPSG